MPSSSSSSSPTRPPPPPPIDERGAFYGAGDADKGSQTHTHTRSRKAKQEERRRKSSAGRLGWTKALSIPDCPPAAKEKVFATLFPHHRIGISIAFPPVQYFIAVLNYCLAGWVLLWYWTGRNFFPISPEYASIYICCACSENKIRYNIIHFLEEKPSFLISRNE